jgi:nickel/cobalt exporter
MPADLTTLCLSAISVGAIHTLLGPDHYVPLVAMSRAGSWSRLKTLGVTATCGLGHVAGSIVVGAVGLVLGTTAMKFEAFEGWRGDAAAWLLIGIGVAYTAWAVRCWTGKCAAGGDPLPKTVGWVPWLAFLVFVLGPCEPLIPMLMLATARAGAGSLVAVTLAFTLATVGTMVAAVAALRYGLAAWPLSVKAGVAHATAGLAILACGVLMKAGF